MKNRSFWGLLALIFFLPACTKDLTQSETKEASETIPRSAGDNNYDLLGYGYDVTGRFANSESAKLQVIDIEKFATQNPSDFDLNTNVEQYFDYYIGGNALEYSSSLSQKYKLSASINKFKGEVNLSFNSSDSYSSKYAYASGYMKIKQKRLRIFALTENLRNNYLRQTFTSDVNTLTPDQLINKYGTHVLINITLGAKLEINYRTETNKLDRKRAVQVGLSANGALKIFGIDIGAGVSGDVNSDRSEASSNYNQALFYRTVGGDGTKGLVGNINLDNSAPQISIGSWQSSCTRENAALIEIDPDGLIPLEDLIVDPAKREAIKTAIEQYQKNKEVKVWDESSPVHAYYSPGLNVFRYEFYTPGNPDLPSYLKDGSWTYKGIYFNAFKYKAPGTVPIYEYWAPSTNDCSWWPTPSMADNYWKGGGIKWYGFVGSWPTNTIPVYGFYHHKSRRSHFLGTNPNSPVQKNEWTNEGVVFYAPK